MECTASTGLRSKRRSHQKFLTLSASATLSPLLLLLLSKLVPGTDSAHILLASFPYRSHVSEVSAIGKGLMERGHRVTILLSASYPHLEQMRRESGFQVVDYAVADPDFYTIEYPDSAVDPMELSMQLDPIDDLRRNVDGVVQFCTNLLADKTLPDRLLKSNYGPPNLALTDGFPSYRCIWILCHQLGIPYVATTAVYEPWLWRVPALPSFVPFPFAGGGKFTEKMTFWQRVENTRTLIDWTAFPRLEMVEDQFVQRYLPGETYATLAARCLLWLIDTDVVTDYPRPLMPNEINIGGLATRPARPLPEGPLEVFARQSTNKLVLVSFGSMDIASRQFFDELFNAFRQLSELNFIWRYDAAVPAKYSDEKLWPKNILLQKWVPQNDLLGHNNTVLFIGHCGANSLHEAVYQAVPLVCLSIWGDQMSNAERMQYRGLGIHVGRFPTVRTDTLADSIREVAFNRKYADNIRHASAIFKSRPMNPHQTAVWWIEHVIEHGASHLRSHAVDMVWYEYLLLDVFAVFVLLPVVIITAAASVLAFWLFSRRKCDSKNQTAAKKKL